MGDRITKKVVIDAYRGGDDIGSSANGIVEKDFNLDISEYIYDRLKSLNIPVSITRDSDEMLSLDNRIKRINSYYGNGSDVIVISNALNSSDDGAKVVYALRNSNRLAEGIADELEKNGIFNIRFFQRRLPSDPAKDYNQLIRDTANNESLIVYYGNISNSDEALNLKNNLESLGEAVVIALADYLNVLYVPVGDNYYIVKKGDSLYSIARKYGTTVAELRELNNLGTNNLSIGQVLMLPVVEDEDLSDEVIYVVKSGDTLYSIAKKYGISVDELKRLNGLTNNNLALGQSLKVSDSGEYVIYKVVSGDTLYSIAKRYGVSVDELKKFNNFNDNNLSIEQIVKIPSGNNYISYKVVSGDTLYNIAKRYGVSVDEIKSFNGMSSNLLSIGQVLKIPN